MTVERAGIAIILARSTNEDAQAAFSLAASVASMEDPAAIFVTQGALAWLKRDLDEDASMIADLRSACSEAGVRLFACSASLAQSGLESAALIDGVEIVGAPTFYRFALQVGVSLYI